MNQDLKYGHQTMAELKLSKRQSSSYWMLRIVAMCGVVIMLVLVAMVITSCSLTLNVAADGQPVNVIYSDEDAGKCE